MSDVDLLATIRAMFSPEASERARGADEITDFARSLRTEHAVLLARLLVGLRLGEHDIECQEAQLNALSELKESFDLETETLLRLRRLPLDSLCGSQREHYDDIMVEIVG